MQHVRDALVQAFVAWMQGVDHAQAGYAADIVIDTLRQQRATGGRQVRGALIQAFMTRMQGVGHAEASYAADVAIRALERARAAGPGDSVSRARRTRELKEQDRRMQDDYRLFQIVMVMLLVFLAGSCALGVAAFVGF